MADKCSDNNNINLYCKTQFDGIKEDMKTIKEAIVGNGKVGYNVRLDRLEQSRKVWSRFEWLITGCLVVILVNSAWSLTVRCVTHFSDVEKNSQHIIDERSNE